MTQFFLSKLLVKQKSPRLQGHQAFNFFTELAQGVNQSISVLPCPPQLNLKIERGMVNSRQRNSFLNLLKKNWCRKNIFFEDFLSYLINHMNSFSCITKHPWTCIAAEAVYRGGQLTGDCIHLTGDMWHMTFIFFF